MRHTPAAKLDIAVIYFHHRHTHSILHPQQQKKYEEHMERLQDDVSLKRTDMPNLLT